MKLNLGNYSLSLNKRISSKSISEQDLDIWNLELVKYLYDLDIRQIKQRLQDITADSSSDDISNIYNKNGILIVPSFLDSNLIHSLKIHVDEINRKINDFLSSNQLHASDDLFLFQKNKSKLKNYNEINNYNKSVVSIRGGSDSGMVDIFNINKALPKFNEAIDLINKSNFLKKFQKIKNKKVRNLNLYLNQSITKTRGFHVDYYGEKVKVFIYLSDCLSLDHGPYTFVKKSHLDNPLRRMNLAASSVFPHINETPFVELENIVPIIASSGSLIISDQSGFHRGFPQKPNHSRSVLVLSIQ